MKGAQTRYSGSWPVRTMMFLRRKKSDASNRIPELIAFSERVVPLIGGASSQPRRLAEVASTSSLQWHSAWDQHLCLNQAIKSDARTSMRYEVQSS